MTTRRPWRGIVPALAAVAALLAGSGASAHPSALRLLAVDYRDLDGDRDRFPDTGETGRVVLTVRNLGAGLTGLTLYLTTDDPDVACINEPVLSVTEIPGGATVIIGSLDPGEPGFTFKASDTLQTVNPADPAKLEFCLNIVPESGGLLKAFCFGLPADLDLPGGDAGTFIVGPDGVAGTDDDGLLLETFDLDRDGDGLFTVLDTFRLHDEGTGQTSSGSYLRGGDPAVGQGVLGGIACGGYTTPEQGNPACALDPDFPMDWHLHCAPGATNCPNVESGACVGGCSYQTPANGQLALSPPNSLHMGAHFDLSDRALGDTTHFRTLQAFVSPPLNLTPLPRPGDLQLSMFQIARLMDNNGIGGGVWVGPKCGDCGDVQVQVDLDPDPAIDEWGVWDKLAPFQNVHDHTAMAWSTFAPIYCLFTPTDTGTAPPAPRGVHETICAPQGAWSSCGSVRGTSPSTTLQCPGPGIVDPSGVGVWVETRFDLSRFLGQRIRVRWVGASWVFNLNASSYYEYGGGWDRTGADDGWWLDNLGVTGVVTRQTPATPDGKPSVGGSCPARSCAPVPPDTLAWWPLDGDTRDVAGGLDGTLVGGAGFGPGQVGSALAIDDIGERMETPLTVRYAGGVSFDAWIRARGFAGVIVSGAKAYDATGTQLRLVRGEVEFHAQAKWQGEVFSLHGGFVADGNFHHVAATWTGDTTVDGAALYVDGRRIATGAASATITEDDGPLLVGRGFNGEIDEVAVTARVLTPDEVEALYLAGPLGRCRTDPCIDGDGDGYGQGGNLTCPGGELRDCDDADPRTHPGAPEWNDGLDNNCPGDSGYGLIDEVDGLTFESPTRVCWPAQGGATMYQVARGVLPDFTGECSLIATTDTCLTETAEPPVIYYYLVRALEPHAGSWGRDSSGTERTGVCGS
jgi:hypothetical protein